MSGPAPLRGLLLSGGFSTRMGQDKGSLIWQDAPLIQRQMRLLRSVTDEVLISCREEQRNAYSSHGDLLIDQLPPQGPITGLLTAFRQDATQAWLVIAVDMPHLDQLHLDRLIRSREPDRIATALKDPTHHILQPLVAIWEPRALPVLESAWANRQFSLRLLLEEHPVAAVTAESSRVLQNLNRPEDLAGQ
ncbi:MAG: molybdenum cofactor guanylyltransferase [Lewinellaceae bacterium]|nr:molybdenum cofactor guanylyltransferase [Saprospiraceae bacterium]MCB9313536.1 molybdenum cofactor guanylyltransferase [Lewinellaceae bacterium]